MSVYKNLASIDLRIMSQCLPKIDRFRVTPLLMALYKAIIADGIHPEYMEQHDKMFEPRNEYERDFWESCRKIAKKEMTSLQKAIEGGKTGGRPKKLTKEEKQESFQKAIKSVGAIGKNEIIITQDFELPQCQYFDDYRKTYTAAEIKKVTDWLKKAKLNEKVDYQWIGKQIQNFKKRDTGKIF